MRRRKKHVPRAPETMAMCGNKVKYDDEATAHRRGMAICRRIGDKRPINSYKCPHCGSFHWGHRRK